MEAFLEVVEPSSRVASPWQQFPVTVGVVLQRGDLEASVVEAGQVALFDSSGSEVPAEIEVAAYWDPERTLVRWLHLTFVTTTAVDGYVVRAPVSSRQNRQPIATVRRGVIHVRTGAMRARIDGGAGDLLSSVRIRGAEQLGSPVRPVHFTGVVVEQSSWRNPDDPEPGPGPPSEAVGTYPTVIAGRATLERATSVRAVVAGACLVTDDSDDPWCRIDWRAEFFQGQSFTRVFHTLTWMRRAWEYGAADISVLVPLRTRQLAEMLVDSDREIGVRHPQSGFYVTQTLDDTESMITMPRAAPAAGRLSGWALATTHPNPVLRGPVRGVGACVRSMWQTYPKGFSVRDVDRNLPWWQRWRRGPVQALSIDLWPRTEQPMSFRPEDLLPEEYVSAARLPEWEPGQFHGAQYNGTNRATAFEHTGEGASRTHEFVLAFGRDASKIEELADLTERPIVLRQDPKESMSIPNMGFNIPPRHLGDDEIGDLEHRLEDLCRQLFLRSHRSMDYGFWRFGALHWNPPLTPSGGAGTYRTFDGTQYGLQMLPWLLFMRGGPREFYDEAVTSARYAMDVATNHYTTRQYLDRDGDPAPLRPGFAADARLFMFPWQASRGTMINKKPKLNYLLACYHLTGWERARQTAELQIRGAVEQFDDLAPTDDLSPQALQAALVPLPPGSSRGMVGGPRERLNTVAFWAEAAAEHGTAASWGEDYVSDIEPRLTEIARRWWDMILAHGSIYLLRNTGARIHMFEGFGLQRLLGHTSLSVAPDTVVAEALAETGFDLVDRGVYDPEYAVGAMWAGDGGASSRDAVLWDLAQGAGDIIAGGPATTTPQRDALYRGHEVLRQLAFPILAGLGAANRAGQTAPPLGTGVAGVVQRDLFLSVGDPNPPGPSAGVAYVECTSSGMLEVTVMVGEYNAAAWTHGDPAITVHRQDSDRWAPTTASVAVLGTQSVERYSDQFERVTIRIPDTAVGDVFRITLERGDARLTRWNVHAVGHRVVHGLEYGRSEIGNLANDRHRCTRLFLKPVGGQPVFLTTVGGAPFTVRDVDTWNVIARSTIGTRLARLPDEASEARLLAVMVSGRNTKINWGPTRSVVFPADTGLHPFVAAHPDEWFLPRW